ncbi:MAG: hypothetical protein ABFC63_08070 [Thermoguttaceae bacterium]
MKSFVGGAMAVFLLAAFAFAASPSDALKYTLRYKFRQGETLRWQVEHLSMVRASVTKHTQATETTSTSLKAWRVTDVRPDGAATFEHRVEWVDMRQKLSGRDELHYDSRLKAKPPAGFETAAKSVGVLLTTVTMDPRGKIVTRKRHQTNKVDPNAAKVPAQDDGWMTIPLPEEAVAIGQSWSIPQQIDIPLETGGVKKIKAVQRFTLEDVKTGVATIRVSTEVLTPITDPAVESQLVQRESAGRVRFDIDEGRVLGQQMDIDKHVVGFRGEASSIHYVNRFSERLVNEPAKPGPLPNN